MSELLPAPYPADTRAKGWRFEIDYEKVNQSSTWSLAAEVPMALLMMWLAAWTQEPCGSLPNDEDVIRAKCRIPVKQWPTLRSILMRGWWLTDDGRLYHDTLVERVKEMRYARDRAWTKWRSALIARDGFMCRYCRRNDDPLTIDHVLPRSLGGGDDLANLALACRPCNSSKGARTPQEWRAS